MFVRFFNIQKTVGAGNACAWAMMIIENLVYSRLFSYKALESKLEKFPDTFGQISSLKAKFGAVRIEYLFTNNVRAFSFDFELTPFDRSIQEDRFNKSLKPVYFKCEDGTKFSIFVRRVLSFAGQLQYDRKKKHYI